MVRAVIATSRASHALALAASLLALAGCDPRSAADDAAIAPDAGSTDAGAAGLEIRPGDGIGPVSVGTRYAEIAAALGPLEGAFVSNRLGFGRYRELGLELVLVSADDGTISEDAIVIGVGALEPEGFHGPVVPGMARAALVAAYGEPDDEAGESDYYVEGFSVEYDGDAVLKVAVFRPYERVSTPPEMQPASTTRVSP